MKTTKKTKKRKSFESDQGYSWVADTLGLTWTPRLFGIGASFNLLGVGLGMGGLIVLAMSYVISFMTILRPVGWVLIVGAVLGTLFVGENGKRFMHFLIPVMTLRKIGIPASEKPVSRTIVRIWSYGSFAFEIGVWLWWQVFTAPPRPDLEAWLDAGGDYLNWLYALQFQAYSQLEYYWWLLPVLVFCVLGLLKLLEWAPIFGWMLRMTRIVPLIIPFVLVLEAVMIYQWWDFTFRPIIP
ncbi:MAG: hypothetical protein A2900_03835 [Candidatus Chisholmbacteria bacterium RIFCSPLOWO2_01_FULL_50_28]|uniref:Uncharacterized protein n=1 Tax=Candidatus Chisholmbacteria bacterium RIFCSPHIGHO2_01_FULL_52_32 TaxID=1797591 RepID=A0A1G1VSP4_9BACT|nr:MAG: hypothetical protein A2786_02910 [Candidatus Chisholmbacteria bacterium RIFCSPHIGHO2_01_FULL_52_32]OGY20204.1 MAG: hypothetical protein A2900_03835 [Candidatus Chisholmbacteria bacterium RIFCSPLOWO2_01_FULL_50_28]